MPKRVLIVEDTIDIGNALQQLIQMEGYEAVLAQTGSEGLELAPAMRPDLIIVDLHLPDVDGIEVIRQLRSSPENADTSIIVVSSYVEGHHREAKEAGSNELYSKSTFIASYRNVLRKYLAEEAESSEA